MMFFTFPSVLLFAALAQAATPTLIPLFNGTIMNSAAGMGLLPGPFGSRVLNKFTGGTLFNASNGDVVANVLPGLGAELGLLGANNVFYPDGRMGFEWVDDSTFAYLEFQGSAVYDVKATTYGRFETNSMSRNYLNGLFTVIVFDLTASPKTFDVYSVDDNIDN